MVNPCLTDEYQGYLLAIQITRMGLVRALQCLRDTPNVGVRAAATTFTSPASTRLKADVTDIGDRIRDAEARIGELVAYLHTLEVKYQRLFLVADAAREKMMKK